jgi:phosphoserine phosphatase
MSLPDVNEQLPDVNEQLSDLQGVLVVARQLGATVDLHTMLSHIEAAALNVMESERASVFLYAPESDELYSYVATGVEEIRFSAKQGLAGAAVQERRTINVPDAYADERFNPEVDKKTGFRTRNVLSLPLLGLDETVVGVLQVLNKQGSSFTAWDEQLAATLAAQAGAAVQRQMLLDQYAEKQKLEHDLDIARHIQQELLPDHPPEVSGFDIAGWNKPADRTGGDAFDYMAVDGGRQAITIADATGHGIGPALVIAECRALLRAMALANREPNRIMQCVNDLLVQDLPADRFVTCFFGFLDPESATMTYSSAGHGPLLHFSRAKERVTELNATGVPLGIMPNMTFDTAEPICFQTGDMMVLVTDGFFEWLSPDEEQFGTDRIKDIIIANKDLPAADLIGTIYRQVVAFARGAPQADDLTAVIIKKI